MEDRIPKGVRSFFLPPYSRNNRKKIVLWSVISVIPNLAAGLDKLGDYICKYGGVTIKQK